MATRKLTPEELQHITRLAKQWGKIVVKHTYGEQGPGLDVDWESHGRRSAFVGTFVR